MDAELYKTMLSMHNKIDSIATEVKEVRGVLNGLDCKVNNDKIKRLEKVVYGMVALIIIAWVGSTVNFDGPQKASAGIKTKVKTTQPK